MPHSESWDTALGDEEKVLEFLKYHNRVFGIMEVDDLREAKFGGGFATGMYMCQRPNCFVITHRRLFKRKGLALCSWQCYLSLMEEPTHGK